MMILREAAGEPVFIALESGKGSRFVGRAGNNFGGVESAIRGASVIGGKARSRNPGFETPALTAVALGAGVFAGVCPRERVVAPFARDAVHPRVYAAIERDSASAASTQDCREDHVLASPRAVGCFGNGQAVCVVCATHFAL